MTTNAKTPRMSDALCTMTYLAEWYDAVALEMTTIPKMAQMRPITSRKMSAR